MGSGGHRGYTASPAKPVLSQSTKYIHVIMILVVSLVVNQSLADQL